MNDACVDRNRIFISYAWEDAAIAEWLARKLMCFGYAIWIDRLFLKGGCTWPEDIDVAIKKRSFCMVHLMSRVSLKKENPSKERQLGLSISKERHGFLIPLNIDGIAPTELPWQLSDLQYIPFQNWSSGFALLIKTLEILGCPKEFATNGVELALRTFFPVNAVKDTPEKLYSNIFPVENIPANLNVYSAEFRVCEDEPLASCWPAYKISDSAFVSFLAPPQLFAEKFKMRCVEIVPVSQKFIHAVSVRNIVKSLVLKSLYEHAKSIGFHEDDKKNLVFPRTYDEGRYFKFELFSGDQAKIGPHGYKTFHGQRINYSLSFRPSLLYFDERYHVVINLHVTTYHEDGTQVEPTKRIAIRKAIVKGWWNKQWYSRCSGIMAKLSGNSSSFAFGTDLSSRIVFSAMPYTGDSPSSLDDVVIGVLSKARAIAVDDYAEDATGMEDVNEE